MDFVADLLGTISGLSNNVVPYVVAAFVAHRRTAVFRIPVALGAGAVFYALTSSVGGGHLLIMAATVTAAQVWIASRVYAGVFRMFESRAPAQRRPLRVTPAVLPPSGGDPEAARQFLDGR